MTNHKTAPLDAFEARLLTELKSMVTAHAADANEVLAASRWKRRSWLIPVGATAAAAAIAVGISGARPTPAFAVTGSNGGKITVTVNRLQGADALEVALRRRGVAADIQYLPAGKACQAGRYTEVHTPGLKLEVRSTSFKVTIAAGAVKPADVFVLSAAVKPFNKGVQAIVDFGIASGPITPCTIIDAQ